MSTILTTQVNFHGHRDEVIKFLNVNVDVLIAVQKAMWNRLEATADVYITPRDQDGRIEWQMRLTSPQGRLTWLVIQRKPGAAINFENA